MEICSRKNPYIFFLIILIWFCFQMHSEAQANPRPYMEIPVGVILDMGSWVGKNVHSWISLAVSEFYMVNSHYKTRIVLHTRDTHGEPLHALSAALDLLKRPKVQAIIGSQSTAEAKFLAVLGDQAIIPILSLSALPYSSNRHPYFLQIIQDETTQVKAITSMALSFGWKYVIVIFEETENGREMATFITNSLQEKSITITYMSAISTSSSYEVLQEELHKLSKMQAKLYIVHASHSLASHILRNAKYLGMMDAGYKWIVTSKTMNFLSIMDTEVIESMQGVVGFKTYIPQSRELHKLIMKLRKEIYQVKDLKDMNVYAISACKGVLALAMAVEKTLSVHKLNKKDLGTISRAQYWGRTILVNQMLRNSFDDLSGNFKSLNASVMAQVQKVINVVGKKEVNVGFWTTDTSFVKNINKLSTFANDGLESIMWPGGVLDNPMHRMLQASSKRLRIGIPRRFRSGPLFDVKRDAQTNSILVSGFCADVFLAAFNRFDDSVSFEYIQYERDYDDLIDRVHKGEVDAAIGDITIIANRSRYVDFTISYTDLGLEALYRNVDANANLWIFMKPLSSDLWLVAACFFILLGIVIWILEHQTNDEFQGSLVQQIGATLWFAFSTLVYAQRQKLESNLSRFVVIVWFFVVLVLVSSYIAALSSLLTVEQIQLASIRGSIGYPSGSLVVKNLYIDKTKGKLYHSYEDVVDMLRNGSKKGGVDVVVDEAPYIKEFLERYPSGYTTGVFSHNTNGFGFVFTKGSNLTLEISTQIASLRETGELQRLEQKWLGTQQDSLSKNSETSPKILNFKGLRGLFLISGVSMAAALFLYTLYYIHESVHYTYTKLTEGRLSFILKFLSPGSTIAAV